MPIHQEVIDSVLAARPDLHPLLTNFAKSFDVTWGRDMRLYGTDVLAFFLRPKKLVAEMFGFERELLLIVHPYGSGRGRLQRE